MTGGATAVVEYLCATHVPGGGMVAGLNPANGARKWIWRPGGLALQDQSTVASSDGVIAVVGSGASDARIPAAHGDLGPSGYRTDEVIGLHRTDGRRLWRLRGIPSDGAVYAGPAQLCVVSRFGVSCRAARTGHPIWQWRPAVVPARGPVPATGGAAAAAGGLLYLVAPTAAAGQINTESTTQRSAPGTFRLVAMSMARGTVAVAVPLPAYHGGPNGVVVSPMSPPGVEGASHGIVLVTPQFHETGIVEALRAG